MFLRKGKIYTKFLTISESYLSFVINKLFVFIHNKKKMKYFLKKRPSNPKNI